MTALTIPRRFNGPRSSANGGWFAGSLVQHLTPTGAATVSLLAPPPLDVALQVTDDDGTLVVTHPTTGATIAKATPSTERMTDPVQPVTADVAAATEPRYAGLTNHPFPTCYSCGTERTDHMNLRPGLLSDRPGTTACVWRAPVTATYADVWAALDCPGGWSVDLAGRPMVLGTMTGQVHRVPSEETTIIMGETTAATERKAHTRTMLWHGDELLGWATATWIAVNPEVFNALQK